MFFKSLLKQYLDGVSVNDDVMNTNNPLLVVNNKVNLNRPPVERMDGTGAPHKTVVEANAVVNNRAMQRNANYFWDKIILSLLRENIFLFHIY